MFNVPWQGHAIATVAGAAFNPAVDVVIANVDGRRLLGGVVYQSFTGPAITMHTAGLLPRWVTRDMLWVCFHYPFVQLGVKKVIGTVPEGNHKALAFNRHLGFKEEAVISDAFPDGNAIVMSMRREDCRWLSLEPANVREGNSRDGWQGSSTEGA